MSVVVQEKQTIAKVTRTREALEALRAEIMKCYPIKRHIKVSEFLGKYKMEASTITYLKELKAIEDHTPAGTLKREGKLFKWIYTRSGENGVVDGQLVEEMIEKHRSYQREWSRANRGIQELSPIIVGHITPKKEHGAAGISEWIIKELEKENQIHGYLRPEYSIMLTRIKEVIDSIDQLKQLVCKLPV